VTPHGVGGVGRTQLTSTENRKALVRRISKEEVVSRRRRRRRRRK
jgi:hypothetical protein